MTAKPMVRFYAVIFNKIGTLPNEIHVDIRSKSEAHQLIKDRIQKHRPGAGFLRHILPAFSLFSAAPGFFLLPKGELEGLLQSIQGPPLIEESDNQC